MPKFQFLLFVLKRSFTCYYTIWMTVPLIRNFILFIKSLKNKKRKLGLTFFYYVIQEIWLGNSKMLICIDHQDSTFSQTRENSKMFNITSKYFSFFNNKPPATWVGHIARDFLTCYSCLYYSFMDDVGSILSMEKISNF